ncbi:MAG: UDP-N-acetylglucosamine 2-epimerase [Legionellaceae bacterium]|nr:UDP-N-acetylglucosamine 2-epimerase [Legionellaceae bacterium]
MKKICVVTGTRAEYGLLRWVMQGIKDSSVLELHVLVTGAHLSPEFGLTYREIEADGFRINHKVEMLLSSDTAVGVTKSMGLAMCGFADVFADAKPDLLLMLGDRFELLAAASAAMIACIPIIHLHGGETTEGAFDEVVRHAITKMSHLHFVAAEEYRNRVIQLGEIPERVFQVGGFGIDNILKLELFSRAALEESLDFKFGPRNLLVTFHPVTLEQGMAVAQMRELLTALDMLSGTHIILTAPNADPEGRVLFEMLDDFVQRHPNTAKLFTSLGQQRYLSCIQHVDGVVGNSSSGLIEVPSFKKGTVNIGDRQQGRMKASSVIDCKTTKLDIQQAIQYLHSAEFQANLAEVVNPYGEGGASEKVVEVLESCDSSMLLKKHFYDLPLRS